MGIEKHETSAAEADPTTETSTILGGAAGTPPQTPILTMTGAASRDPNREGGGQGSRMRLVGSDGLPLDVLAEVTEEHVSRFRRAGIRALNGEPDFPHGMAQ